MQSKFTNTKTNQKKKSKPGGGGGGVILDPPLHAYATLS